MTLHGVVRVAAAVGMVAAATQACTLIGLGDYVGEAGASDGGTGNSSSGNALSSSASFSSSGAAATSSSSAASASSSSAASSSPSASSSLSSSSSSSGGGADAGWLGAPRCAGSGLAICETFEDAPLGGFPTGWSRRNSFSWGGTSIGVDNGDAMRGTKALRVEGGESGSQFMIYDGALGALASQHYGRLFFKMETPAPWPSSGVLHGDIVQGEGPSPRTGEDSNVRWGIVENTQQRFQWIYNVQPYNSDPEFGDGTSYNYTWPGQWQCMEWHYDQTAQTGTLWIDEQQIPITVGASHEPEIPVFTNMAFGWSNYQAASGAGFVLWIDEVAMDANRIGCDR